MAWTTVNNRVLSDSDFSNMNVIRELLYIKHNFVNMTLYSKDEIDLLYKLYFIFFIFDVFMFVYSVRSS